MILQYQSRHEIAQLKELARISNTPLYGAFELTNKCNFKCKMCYIHDQAIENSTQGDLSTDQWKRIMSDAVDAGMMFALLSGGECLLRSDFKELYLFLYNKGVIMSINTNAFYIDEDYVQFFSKYKPERIQISLYGSSNEAYYNITCVENAFDKVDSAINLLTASGLKPDIALSASKLMYNDFQKLVDYVKAHNLDFTYSLDLSDPRDGHSINNYFLTDDEQITLSRIAAAARKTIIKPSTPAPSPGYDDNQECNLGMPCNAGTIRFVVTNNGEMIPCMSIPEIHINMLKHSFNKCWSYITSEMRKVKQPVECKNCIYQKKCPHCPVHRYDGLFSGHCKKRNCSLTLRKYEEGIITLPK